jgi:esterase/lipase superfamily enzyme
MADVHAISRAFGSLASKMPSLNIPIVAFDWVSKGATASYFKDEVQVEWSMPHFRRFLVALHSRFPEKKIDLLSFSMGNRIVVETLSALALAKDMGAMNVPTIGHVFLTSADSDAETLLEAVPDIVRVANDLTIYQSSRDQALWSSQHLHGYARGGEAGDEMIPGTGSLPITFGPGQNDVAVIPNVTGIDASFVHEDPIACHSYFTNSIVMNDIAEVLNGSTKSADFANRHPPSVPNLASSRRLHAPYFELGEGVDARPCVGKLFVQLPGSQ